MARAAITADTLTAGGYNLTDSADFTTLSTGDGNGVSFAYNSNDLLVLKNDTGGGAVFTIKVPTPTDYSSRVTVNDESVSVAAAKTYLYKLTPIFKQSDGDVYVDCDIAGKVVVLRDPTA